MQIKEHVFIVTGASSGIGLSTAIALSDRGAKVALFARSNDALQKLAQQHPGSLPVAMQAVIPVMREQGGGSIVNINSGTAFMTIPQYSVYSASKRALLGFSLTARAELEKDRIVVSEI